MKFTRRDTPTVMSGLVIRYVMTEEYRYDGQINASRYGVCISGSFPVMDTEDTVLVEETLGRARIHALRLAAYPFGTPYSEGDVEHILRRDLPLYAEGER